MMDVLTLLYYLWVVVFAGFLVALLFIRQHQVKRLEVMKHHQMI